LRIPSVLAAYVGGIASDFRSNKWQREDHPIYPMSALREGVLNALVHRDYNLTGSTLISIAPDSLQISNPGGLPPGLTTADLKRDHPSLPRNPDIAHILFLHGLIEKVGRGTQHIICGGAVAAAEIGDQKGISGYFRKKILGDNNGTD